MQRGENPSLLEVEQGSEGGRDFILTDYFAMSGEEKQTHKAELCCMKAEQGINDDDFYHYDTPLTVEHETVALLSAGLSAVEVLGNWGQHL